MNLIDQIHRYQRIHQLIRMKATGPPCQFSDRLGISERQLYRLLDELKSYGLPIEYCRVRQSYIYTREVEMEILFVVREIDTRRIRGGQTKFSRKFKNFFFHCHFMAVNMDIFSHVNKLAYWDILRTHQTRR